MKRILRGVEERWLALKPWQREMIAGFVVGVGAYAMGYWSGYRDGGRD